MNNTRCVLHVSKTTLLAALFGGAAVSYGAKQQAAEPSADDRLKEERAKPGTPLANPPRGNALRVKAARSGDETERKGILDQLKDSGDARSQFEASEMAKAIGGMDMIRGFGSLLSDTNLGWRAINKFKVTLKDGREVWQSDNIFHCRADEVTNDREFVRYDGSEMRILTGSLFIPAGARSRRARPRRPRRR
jgi:hypothetical protein